MNKGGQNANPRRRVLWHMREMRRVTKKVAAMWTVTSLIYVPSDHPRGHDIIPRPDDQYPENMRWCWDHLYRQAEILRDQADALMRLAYAEYHKLPPEVGGKNV